MKGEATALLRLTSSVEILTSIPQDVTEFGDWAF